MSETMSGSALAPELKELIESRASLQAWLSGLEAQRGVASERILERVRADYESRLAATEQELSSHVSGIQSELDRAVVRSAAAEKIHDAANDALEEGRLRHAIGELPGTDWGEQERQLMQEVQVARIAEDEARSEVDRLRDLLATLEGSAAGTEVEEDVPDSPVEDVGSFAEVPVSSVGVAASTGAVVASPSAATPASAGFTASPSIQVDTEPTIESGPLRSPEDGIAPVDVAAAQPIAADAPVNVTAREAPDLFDPDDVPPPEMTPPPGLKCAECGYTNDLSAWFCGVCGADVG